METATSQVFGSNGISTNPGNRFSGRPMLAFDALIAVNAMLAFQFVYMLKLIEAGICGVIPGLAVSDLLQRIWGLARTGDKHAAYDLFQGVLPQTTSSLQNLEFFHHAEKALLAARGVLSNPAIHDATLTINEVDRHHIDFPNSKIIVPARIQTSRAGAGSHI